MERRNINNHSISITFFHSKAKRFFGNTLHQIIDTSNTDNDVRNSVVKLENTVFWRSKVSENGNYVVLEFRRETSEVPSKEAYAFTLIPLVNNSRDTMQFSIFKGTSRKLLYLPLGMISYESIEAYLPKTKSKIYVRLKKTVSLDMDLLRFPDEDNIICIKSRLPGFRIESKEDGEIKVEFADDMNYCDIIQNFNIEWPKRTDYEITLLDTIDFEHFEQAERFSRCRKTSFLGGIRQKRLSLTSRSEIKKRFLHVLVHNTFCPLFSKSLELTITDGEGLMIPEAFEIPLFHDDKIALIFSLEYLVTVPQVKSMPPKEILMHVAGQIFIPNSIPDQEYSHVMEIKLIRDQQIYSIFNQIITVSCPFEFSRMAGRFGLPIVLLSLRSRAQQELSIVIADTLAIKYQEQDSDEATNNKEPNCHDNTKGGDDGAFGSYALQVHRVDIEMDALSVSDSSQGAMQNQSVETVWNTDFTKGKATCERDYQCHLMVDKFKFLSPFIHDMKMYMVTRDPSWIDSNSDICPRSTCEDFISAIENENNFKGEKLQSLIVKWFRNTVKNQFVAEHAAQLDSPLCSKYISA